MENGKEAAKPSSSTAGKPIICKAAILWKPGEKYTVQNIVVAAPKKNQVRVKILHTSICHTDVTCSKLEEAAPLFPAILGHESAGIVESVGEDVTNMKADDHVLPYLQGQCNDCVLCRSDKTISCKNIPLTALSPNILEGTEPCYTTEDGKPISVFMGLSTFSQYILVHKSSVAKINPLAPLDKVGPLSCGLATGFGAAWNVAKVEKGSTVAVFGLGTVGLAVVEACKIAGASKIIGVDINPSKADLGKKFGTTDFINPKDHPDVPLSKLIMELTGDGVEYCFECVGVPNLMAEAVESTNQIIGVTVLVGLYMGSETFGVSCQNILWGRTITGTLLGRYKVKDLPGLVERGMKKDFDLDAYITHTMPLSKINEAMEIFKSGECLRINLNTEE